MTDLYDRAQERAEFINATEVATGLAKIRIASTLPGLSDCADCDGEIEEARKRAVPSARRCVSCQALAEQRAASRKGV